jgi:hypothetical protein
MIGTSGKIDDGRYTDEVNQDGLSHVDDLLLGVLLATALPLRSTAATAASTLHRDRNG